MCSVQMETGLGAEVGAQQWEGRDRDSGRAPPPRKMLRKGFHEDKRRTRQADGLLAGGRWVLAQGLLFGRQEGW